MKKQGYNSRLDESLGSKHGKKKQTLRDRRHESEAMEKKEHKRKYASDKDMDKNGRMAEVKKHVKGDIKDWEKEKKKDEALLKKIGHKAKIGRHR